jgi:hypothetical protein
MLPEEPTFVRYAPMMLRSIAAAACLLAACSSFGADSSGTSPPPGPPGTVPPGSAPPGSPPGTPGTPGTPPAKLDGGPEAGADPGTPPPPYCPTGTSTAFATTAPMGWIDVQSGGGASTLSFTNTYLDVTTKGATAMRVLSDSSVALPAQLSIVFEVDDPKTTFTADQFASLVHVRCGSTNFSFYVSAGGLHAQVTASGSGAATTDFGGGYFDTWHELVLDFTADTVKVNIDTGTIHSLSNGNSSFAATCTVELGAEDSASFPATGVHDRFASICRTP